MLRLNRILLAVIPLATLTACLSTSPTEGSAIALITMNARVKGAGYTTAPVANFYKASSITFASSGAATDTCQAGAYSSAVTPTTAAVISGGANIAVKLAGKSDTLRKVSTTDLTYKLASASGITFTPGDSVTFTNAGDVTGFFSTTFTGKTAEAFTASPITVPAAGQPLAITWTAATDGNSALIVSLRYNDGTGSGVNAQIFCDFRDDGAGTVPAALAAKWAASTERTTVMQRLRTAVIVTTSTQYINLISTFELPTPTSP